MTFSTLLIELLSAFGSVASLVSLAWIMRPPDKPFTVGEGVGFTVAGLLIVVFGVTRLREYFRLRPKACKTPKQIRDYMHRWISRGERVAIFSRDMSWVDDKEMLNLLQRRLESGS